MKIAFVSENGFTGKVPEDFNNARTEFMNNSVLVYLYSKENINGANRKTKRKTI